MNKTELKNFAVSARRDLLEKVALRAKIFGIDEKNDLKTEEQFGQVIVNGIGYPLQMKSAFNSLTYQLKTKGYHQLLEEVAYIWFNRIIAIRYMEVHDYLPSRVNVLSSNTGKAEPDILTLFETVDLEVDIPAIKDIIHQGKTEEAYRNLFIAQCNALNKILPFMFEKINDYTELLLPDFLLDSESVISNLTKNEELSESFQEVEVIGWLYQFYNSEPKDKVFANLKKNKKIEKYDIPAATQLFTPKWIVQYMVENSLGQLWVEANPYTPLKEKMKHYIVPVEQEEGVNQLLKEISYKEVNIEEITIIDPCVGSGHILVYAFDLLYQMYEEAGYPISDIPQLILEKNLYGLDIDERASQLASFALMMKGREKSRRIFRKHIALNIHSIRESNNLDKEEIAHLLSKNEEEKVELQRVIEMFINAKNFGSILQPPKINYDKYLVRIQNLREEQLTTENYLAFEQIPILLDLIKQAKLLSNKYDVVVTNPPYMYLKGMNQNLSEFLKKYYKDSKYDLFAVFIERCNNFLKKSGFHASINQQSWMFLSSFEKLRNKILNNYLILSMLHLGAKAFEEVDGEVVQSTSYIIRNISIENYKAKYYRLVHYNNTFEKSEIFNKRLSEYIYKQEKFHVLPGSPLTYWSTDKINSIFKKYPALKEIAEPKCGLSTTDNNRFLRLWFEVPFNSIGFYLPDRERAIQSNRKWFPYNKGGSFRKWYGNLEYVVNWFNDGIEIKANAKGAAGGRVVNTEYYFRKGITWSLISSNNFGVRAFPEGMIFDVVSHSLFTTDDKYYFYTGLLNSKVCDQLLSMLNPTLAFSSGVIGNMPVVNSSNVESIDNIVKENIKISRFDWDSFETSWNFRIHPYLDLREDKNLLSEVFFNWEQQLNTNFTCIKNNEEKLNEIFINLYGLQEEITREVSNEKITIRKADRNRDSKLFLSYFIGCMMGRYSLDIEGLAFAGSDWDESKYRKFKPNKYGLVQLNDENYFEDDIIVRLKEFLRINFGFETVDENIQWLAESLELKSNESAEDRLRRYFQDEFFKDHCQVYQKRPIYWLVDSGKQKGLRTLIYMHRYQPDTMATIRFEHLQEIQAKYHYEISAVDARIVNPNLSATEKRELEKRKTNFQKRLDELLEFDKKLAEYANAQKGIDLDDGVNVNYQKFEKVLAKIK